MGSIFRRQIAMVVGIWSHAALGQGVSAKDRKMSAGKLPGQSRGFEKPKFKCDLRSLFSSVYRNNSVVSFISL